MVCVPCQRHREDIRTAARTGDVRALAQVTTKAAVALGKNTAGKVAAMLARRK